MVHIKVKAENNNKINTMNTGSNIVNSQTMLTKLLNGNYAYINWYAYINFRI